MLKIIFISVFLCASNVHALRSFLLGHSKNYNIPPPPVSVRSEAVATKYFQQKLDHYDPTNKAIWSQRYYVNPDFFNTTAKNVVFLFLGGEGQASISWMSAGAWVTSGKKYGALLFQLEHRFYGQSQPLPDLSLENLRYLSSQQALADIATFIDGMNKEYELASDVKWIVFGGSYSGSLAAWLRVKYPHLVHGVMSASGPLFAKLNFPEYLQKVAEDLASHSQECVDNLVTAVNQLETLLRSSSWQENVTSLFNLCDSIEDDVDNPWDVANFFQAIIDIFAGTAQYNKVLAGRISVDDLCNILIDEALGTEVYRLAVINGLNGDDCLSYKFDSDIEYLKNVVTTPSGNSRQWFYQTCTEYGWYQTTDQEVQVFGNRITVDFYTKVCSDVFGQAFNETFITEQTKRTNIDYGSLDIEVSNTVFVHGSFDPWSTVGLTETKNPEAPVIYIDGTAHCANMYDNYPEDLPQLRAARVEVDRLIGVWLGVN